MFECDSADTCAGKFPLVSMGGQAEGLACADPVERTPIGASGNFYRVVVVWGYLVLTADLVITRRSRRKPDSSNHCLYLLVFNGTLNTFSGVSRACNLHHSRVSIVNQLIAVLICAQPLKNWQDCRGIFQYSNIWNTARSLHQSKELPD